MYNQQHSARPVQTLRPDGAFATTKTQARAQAMADGSAWRCLRSAEEPQ